MIITSPDISPNLREVILVRFLILLQAGALINHLINSMCLSLQRLFVLVARGEGPMSVVWP